jgi:tetratricopeptide (TPR) repeat protein
VEQLDHAGDLRMASSLSATLGFIECALGLAENADARLRWALSQGERLGTPTTVALAKHNLGLARLLQGDLGGAIRVEREAMEEAAAQGDKRIEVASRVYLARFELAAGNLAEAEKQARRALEGAAPQMEVYAYAVLSRALLAGGDAPAALRHAQHADRLLAELKAVEEGDAFVAVALARALAAVGRTGEAKSALEAGRRRLSARAATITSEALLARFLALPDHAELLGCAL